MFKAFALGTENESVIKKLVDNSGTITFGDYWSPVIATDPVCSYPLYSPKKDGLYVKMLGQDSIRYYNIDSGALLGTIFNAAGNSGAFNFDFIPNAGATDFDIVAFDSANNVNRYGRINPIPNAPLAPLETLIASKPSFGNPRLIKYYQGKIFMLSFFPSQNKNVVLEFDFTGTKWMRNNTDFIGFALLPNTDSCSDFVFDKNGKAYISAGNNVLQFNANGTSAGTLFTTGIIKCFGLTIDPVDPNMLYIICNTDSLNPNQREMFSYNITLPAAPSSVAAYNGITASRVTYHAIYNKSPVTAVGPDAYLEGGYQSPSVILTDRIYNMPVPLGGMGSGPWDTVLLPSTDYDFSAEIHLSYIFFLLGYFGTLTVRFWALDGGLGASGTLLDTQTIDFWGPDYPTGILPVSSQVPFTSAPLGGHRCAVVSISNLKVTDSNGYNVVPNRICNDATDTSMIPEPLHGCSAWRNTESQIVRSRRPWDFKIGLGKFNPKIKSTHAELEIHTQLVPAAWHRSERILRLKKRFKEANTKSKIVFFLKPGFRDDFKHVDLKIKTDKAKLLRSEQGIVTFSAKYSKDSDNLFKISGSMPASVVKGDILLVNIIAHYKNKENQRVKSIEFLKILYVVDKTDDLKLKS